MRLLLIDDNETEHRLFKAFFEHSILQVRSHEEDKGKSGLTPGSRLDCVLNIESAQQKLAANAYDAVFIDDRLTPTSNAMDTLSELADSLADTRIYVISAALDSIHLQNRCNGIVEDVIDKFELFDRLPGILETSIH